MPPGTKRDHPRSPQVKIGQERPFTLYTHCGIDLRVDFDGSFWQSYAPKDLPPLGNPDQEGTMTLLTDEVAVFRFENHGDERSIYFVRNDTAKPELACD
jgi:hypothetical protein